MSHIYFNVHRKNYSVRNKVNGSYKVTHHMMQLAVYEANSTVQQAGRRRVIATKQKNVHAYIIGRIEAIPTEPTIKIADIYYNPYKVDEFKALIVNSKEILSLNEILNDKGKSISNPIIIGTVVNDRPKMELHTLVNNNAPMLTREYYKYMAEAYNRSIELHKSGYLVVKSFDQDYSRTLDSAWYVEYYV